MKLLLMAAVAILSITACQKTNAVKDVLIENEYTTDEARLDAPYFCDTLKFPVTYKIENSAFITRNPIYELKVTVLKLVWVHDDIYRRSYKRGVKYIDIN